MRQVNGVVHSLARASPCHPSLHIHHNIPFCIDSLINNEKLYAYFSIEKEG